MVGVRLVRYGRKELYKVLFPFDLELLEKIKTLSTDQRDYDVNDKIWSLTAVGVYNLILLYKGRNDIVFNFEDDKQKELFKNIITKHKNRLKAKKEKIEAVLAFNHEILKIKEQLPELTKDFDYSKYLKAGIIPMPHQVQGAYFANRLSEQNGSTLLAMDLGVGKTITSILAVQMEQNLEHVLYIVPANLRLNIQVEVEKFTDEFCYVVKAKKHKTKGYSLTNYKRNKGRTLEECKYIVVSYDYFSSSKFDANEKILGIGLHNIQMIVFDEAHSISNKHSNRSVNIKKSYDTIVKKRIALTATPVKNNITKFFPLLKMLKPEEFSNEAKFLTEYCGMYYDPIGENGYPGWVQGKVTNFEGLYEKIQTFTFRVKKEDVLKDLPPIMINKVLIEMTDAEAKEYADIEQGFKKVDWSNSSVTNVVDEDSKVPIVILSRLKQYTATLKVKKVLEIIEELNSIGEKVIVFDAFKKPLYALKELLGDNTKIYSGDQSADQKQYLVEEFQDKDSKLINLLISLMAGNAGITLTQAANVIQMTLSHVPADNNQAYGRAHRIGQQRQVTVFLILIADTIDEVIYNELQYKEGIISAVVDGEKHVDTSEESVLSEVLAKMREKYK